MPSVTDEEIENCDGLAHWRAELRQHTIFTPKVVTFFFCVLQFMFFIDRGVFEGALQAVREDHRLAGDEGVMSGGRAGLLASLFMIGYTIAAPGAVVLGKYLQTRHICAIAMALWSVSLFLTGAANSYGLMLFARILDGCGEALVSPVLASGIDNIAPRASRTLWIGMFYMCIAVGTSLGMLTGGLISKSVVSDSSYLGAGWRFVYLLLGALAFVSALIFLILPHEYNLHDHDDDDDEEIAANLVEQQEEPASPATEARRRSAKAKHVPFFAACKSLLCNNNKFVALTIAASAYEFILSGVASWLIVMLRVAPVEINVLIASVATGGTMLLGGIGGTISGSMLTDRVTRAAKGDGFDALWRACAVILAMMVLSCPIAIAAILLLKVSFVAFQSLFTIGVFLLLGAQPCIINAVLRVASPSVSGAGDDENAHDLRTHALALTMVIQHALGDGPAPAIIGAIADGFGANCVARTANASTCLNMANSSDGVQFSLNSSDYFVLSNDTESCRWVQSDQPGENSFCASSTQLIDAMLICLCVYGVMIPATAWVMLTAKRQAGAGVIHLKESSGGAGKGSELREQELMLMGDANPMFEESSPRLAAAAADADEMDA